MKQLFRAGLALTFFVQATAGNAHEPIYTIEYPQLAPRAMLPAVLTSLKHSLKDPHSIRDFTICRPYRLGLKAGRPHTWATMLSFSAKNGVGGYDGVATYAAAFKDGAVRDNISKVGNMTNNGLNRLFDRAIAEDMRGCESIRDEDVQEMLLTAP